MKGVKMTGVESLANILDTDVLNNIREMTDCFVNRLRPIKVILFGSFADGTYTNDSDFDFYIVVPDGSNVREVSNCAYKSVRYVKQRPVDIVIGTKSRYERYGRSLHSLYVEGEVYRKGIVLYDCENNPEARREAV